MTDRSAVISCVGVSKTFEVRGSKATVKAVSDVTISIEPGSTLALVGESGSGKTTIGRLILGLLKPTAGEIYFQAKDVGNMSGSERRELRAGIQAVFQDPLDSLDPRMRVGSTVAEPLICLHITRDKKELRQRLMECMELVGLENEVLQQFPAELSGGEQQRVGIARALASRPKLIVLDEPTSGLSPVSRAQILETLRRVQNLTGVAYLFITHDLAIVESIADSVAVMYLGRIVESGAASTIFEAQAHPYTSALLDSVLFPDPRRAGSFRTLRGEIPSPIDLPVGCAFASRCGLAQDECRVSVPELREFSKPALPERLVACYRPGQVAAARRLGVQTVEGGTAPLGAADSVQ